MRDSSHDSCMCARSQESIRAIRSSNARTPSPRTHEHAQASERICWRLALRNQLWQTLSVTAPAAPAAPAASPAPVTPCAAAAPAAAAPLAVVSAVGRSDDIRFGGAIVLRRPSAASVVRFRVVAVLRCCKPHARPPPLLLREYVPAHDHLLRRREAGMHRQVSCRFVARCVLGVDVGIGADEQLDHACRVRPCPKGRGLHRSVQRRRPVLHGSTRGMGQSASQRGAAAADPNATA